MRVEMSSNEIALFNWLHLSDIHFGHGTASDRWDQTLVLNELLKDVGNSLKNGFPKPHVVLITGDIANTGDSIIPQENLEFIEYREAGKWISDLSRLAGLSNQNIFMVPGNHDVQRNVGDTNRNLQRLINGLRDGRDSIDEALEDKDDRCRLASRMKNFTSFSSVYAPACISDSLSEDFMYWQYRLITDYGLCVKIVGLNTSIISTGDDDKKKLHLGSGQLGKLILSESRDNKDLVVALSHHPFSWLSDEINVCAWVQSNCNIHLHGHLHDTDTRFIQAGGGARIIEIGAGAVHSERDGVIGHGYMWVSIIADSKEEKIKIRIMPRSWSNKNKDFRVDVDNVPPGSQFVEYPLELPYINYSKIVDTIRYRTDNTYITYKQSQDPKLDCTVETSKNKIRKPPESISSDFPPALPAWVGREAELELLNDKNLKVIVITGIGGQGKSALAARYIDTLSKTNPNMLWDWRDCREQGDTLHTHILRIIERFSSEGITAEPFIGENITTIIDYFFTIIGNETCLFVFDNIDHYVDSEMSKPIHGMKYLLESALRKRNNIRIIITCRPSITYDDPAFFQISLSGLSVFETQRLFELRGVDINNINVKRNIADAQMITQGHPLWLNLIATQVAKNKADLGKLLSDIKRGTNVGLPTTMLRSIWKTLNDKQRWFLRCMAEAVRPETTEQLAEYLSADLNWNQFSKSLRSLKALDLVVVKTAPSGNNTLELHPVIKSFILNEFPKSEREKFIIRISSIFDKVIKKLKGSISGGTSFVILENWTLRAELAINAGKYQDALEALSDVTMPILSAGHAIEFVRVAKRLFEDIDYTNAILNEYKHFDDVFSDFVDTISQLGRYEECEFFLTKYEGIILGKSARYVNLCNMRCYMYWSTGKYDLAIDWGNRGVKLKNETNIDTRHDCQHNLALANRDGGYIDSALEYFLGGSTIKDVLDLNIINKEKGGPFYGNIGRCLWLKNETSNALLCYKKSARLLEYTYDKSSVVNRGWASEWIGEALEKQNKYPLAWRFFQRAYYQWREISPPKATRARIKAEDILIKHSDIIIDIESDMDNYANIERQCRNWIESDNSVL
jgi:tetratricopeptide (TPR) repeat protein